MVHWCRSATVRNDQHLRPDSTRMSHGRRLITLLAWGARRFRLTPIYINIRHINSCSLEARGKNLSTCSPLVGPPCVGAGLVVLSCK